MTVADPVVVGAHSAEIARPDVSGGTNTSHTIVVPALSSLLEAVPADASASDYEAAVLAHNVLGKDTDGARRRTLRYLRELYLLRPDSLLFRALRDLWPLDPAARPLLAGLCALARDPVFRASSAAIIGSSPGDTLTAPDLAEAVGSTFPDSYSASTLAKIGRNTFSSWEQTGHLGEPERTVKVRTRATCRPANVAYALLLGHLEGVRGSALFDTTWAQVLDQPGSHLLDLATTASQHGMVELRRHRGSDERLRRAGRGRSSRTAPKADLDRRARGQRLRSVQSSQTMLGSSSAALTAPRSASPLNGEVWAREMIAPSTSRTVSSFPASAAASSRVHSSRKLPARSLNTSSK